MQYAIQLCNILGITFEIEPLDCQPFYHGYGMQCSEAQLVIGIWKLPMSYLRNTEFYLPFYIVPGDGYLLVGNNIAEKSKVLNDENLLVIPPNTQNLSTEELVLSTYHSEFHRTRLLVVPSSYSSVSSYFNSIKYFKESALKDPKKFINDKYCKWFAFTLHAFTHFTLSDMI